MPQPDFSKLINLPTENVLEALSKTPGEMGFLGTKDVRAAIEAGVQWWEANGPLLQQHVCQIPELQSLNSALAVASPVFAVLSEVVGEYKATYAAVLIAQQGLNLFCKSYWDNAARGAGK